MVDMTKGKASKLILAFALPLIISNLFQQAYNLVDTMIVGNFAGVDSLAAVGAASPVTMLLVSLGNGASMGVGVVIGQFFGAKEYQKLKTSSSTSLIAFLIMSLVLLGIGLGLSTPLLNVLQTPDNIFKESQSYLNIYIMGLPFLFLYNCSNAIFNGMGDSRKPLYFLIFSSVLNVLLDLLFVARFHWGVVGAAVATLIAQGAAAILAVSVLLYKLKTEVPGSGRIFWSGELLKKISRIGIPTMLQLASVSIGGLLVQSIVNPYGSDAIAGYSAALKLNSLASVVVNTLGSALSTFTAQNIGAKQFDRPAQGIRTVLRLELIYSTLLVLLAIFFGRTFIKAFGGSDSTQAMLDTGYQYLLFVMPGYYIFTVMNIFTGICRGAGYMLGFTFSTMCDITCRCVLSFILNSCFGIVGIWIAIPIGWVIGAALGFYFYKKGNWKRNILA